MPLHVTSSQAVSYSLRLMFCNHRLPAERTIFLQPGYIFLAAHYLSSFSLPHFIRRYVTSATGKLRLNKLRINDSFPDECGAVGGMRIGRGNRSTRIKPALVPLFPPQIPHDLNWSRTRVAQRGNRNNHLVYDTAGHLLLQPFALHVQSLPPSFSSLT
jgi:hypothetical protein